MVSLPVQYGKRTDTDYLDNQSESPAYTDENGQFWFHNLEPGTHTVSAGHQGWIPIMIVSQGVQPGATTNVGEHVMQIGSERILADGFED